MCTYRSISISRRFRVQQILNVHNSSRSSSVKVTNIHNSSAIQQGTIQQGTMSAYSLLEDERRTLYAQAAEAIESFNRNCNLTHCVLCWCPRDDPSFLNNAPKEAQGHLISEFVFAAYSNGHLAHITRNTDKVSFSNMKYPFFCNVCEDRFSKWEGECSKLFKTVVDYFGSDRKSTETFETLVKYIEIPREGRKPVILLDEETSLVWQKFALSILWRTSFLAINNFHLIEKFREYLLRNGPDSRWVKITCHPLDLDMPDAVFVCVPNGSRWLGTRASCVRETHYGFLGPFTLTLQDTELERSIMPYYPTSERVQDLRMWLINHLKETHRSQRFLPDGVTFNPFFSTSSTCGGFGFYSPLNLTSITQTCMIVPSQVEGHSSYNIGVIAFAKEQRKVGKQQIESYDRWFMAIPEDETFTCYAFERVSHENSCLEENISLSGEKRLRKKFPETINDAFINGLTRMARELILGVTSCGYCQARSKTFLPECRACPATRYCDSNCREKHVNDHQSFCRELDSIVRRVNLKHFLHVGLGSG